VNEQASKAEIFDVFLCHNSEDKPTVRAISQQLVKEGIKPWLDEDEIRPGTLWQTAIAEQIESIKSAAVFVGENGLGLWQNEEIQGFLSRFVERKSPVIPVLLPSAQTTPKLPLQNRHYVDFRAADSHPLQRLIWGITGKKPEELAHVPSSERPPTMEGAKGQLVLGRDDQAGMQKVRFADRESFKGRLYPPLAEEPDKEQATQLEILRRRVKKYWVDGVLRHSLHNELLISLGKRQTRHGC
jgi:TIR domain